ncbi:MAG: alpha/beta hydrolase [Novosphingobium sp.]
MPKERVLDLNIAYEIIGDGDRTAVITGGGRYSKDAPGIRDLAENLAAGGLKVLIWDRPNCGESDVCFIGDNEWTLNADVLAGLLRKLDLAPAFVIGGSAGSRISLLTAKRHPDVVRKLAILWVSGGALMVGTHIQLYCSNAAFAAFNHGMEAVLEEGWFKECVARNPDNRDRILSQDVASFVATMDRWAEALIPQEGSPVPGLVPDDFRAMKVRTLVFNSLHLDVNHRRCWTEMIADLMPNARLEELPFDERAWADRHNRGGTFSSWGELAPPLLAFERE